MNGCHLIFELAIVKSCTLGCVVMAASMVGLVSDPVIKVEVVGLVVIPPLKVSISSILSLTVLKDQSLTSFTFI